MKVLIAHINAATLLVVSRTRYANNWHAGTTEVIHTLKAGEEVEVEIGETELLSGKEVAVVAEDAPVNELAAAAAPEAATDAGSITDEVTSKTDNGSLTEKLVDGLQGIKGIFSGNGKAEQ